MCSLNNHHCCAAFFLSLAPFCSDQTVKVRQRKQIIDMRAIIVIVVAVVMAVAHAMPNDQREAAASNQKQQSSSSQWQMFLVSTDEGQSGSLLLRDHSSGDAQWYYATCYPLSNCSVDVFDPLCKMYNSSYVGTYPSAGWRQGWSYVFWSCPQGSTSPGQCDYGKMASWSAHPVGCKLQ